jgi:hypothetical protein
LGSVLAHVGRDKLKLMVGDSGIHKIMEVLCESAMNGEMISHNELQNRSGLGKPAFDKRIKILIELGIVEISKYSKIHKQKIFYELRYSDLCFCGTPYGCLLLKCLSPVVADALAICVAHTGLSVYPSRVFEDAKKAFLSLKKEPFDEKTKRNLASIETSLRLISFDLECLRRHISKREFKQEVSENHCGQT